ncbi:MAG: tRNA 2-thiouridine(34) synthase MnmA [Desulfobacteraceae bacterium]|nr:MAG: tRNA 2-thiouridine(34) synthase MnmA [Desulfobacteraceae bacterium]
MKKKTAIAISGGIDSLVSAYLLKEEGCDVTGIHFLTGYEEFGKEAGTKKETALRKISGLAGQLDIPIEILDCSREFKAKVVDYFRHEYRAGKTPNPCLVCNPLIKFGTVLDFALKHGAEYLATGHYAGKIKGSDGLFHLIKGVDKIKEQSYFLSFLTQAQLARAVFPLSGFTKQEVISLAGEKGLLPAFESESQDICFIKEMSYGRFLSQETGFAPEPGAVVDISGKRIGSHGGIHLFTVGQRRGINCPAAEPYYVISTDAEKNLVVVGSKDDLLKDRCRVTGINWISEEQRSPVEVHTRIRYRNNAVISTLIPEGRNSATVIFRSPQQAVTPGQGAVFYRENEVLGGGFIDGFVHQQAEGE